MEQRHFLGFSGASKMESMALLRLADECFKLFEVNLPGTLPVSERSVVVLASWITRDLPQTDYDHRTLEDYEEAAKRLGILTLSARPDGLEPLTNVMQSIKSSADNLGVERAVVVVRHPGVGVPNQASRFGTPTGCQLSIVNGGDGRHEDPAEALSHIQFACHATRRPIEESTWLLFGDFTSQPVAASLFWGLHCLGATLHLAGPPICVPKAFGSLSRVTIHERLKTAPTDLDGVLIASASSTTLSADIPFTLGEYFDADARDFAERLSTSGAKVFECDAESQGTAASLSFFAESRTLKRPHLFAVSARAAMYRLVLEARDPRS
jgi:aspartate carbamoyltransferase catalytic subunit